MPQCINAHHATDADAAKQLFRRQLTHLGIARIIFLQQLELQQFIKSLQQLQQRQCVVQRRLSNPFRAELHHRKSRPVQRWTAAGRGYREPGTG